MTVRVLVSAETMEKPIAHHGRVSSAEEIIFERFLRGSELCSEPRYAYKIGEDDTDIEVTHRMHWSLAHVCERSECNHGNIRRFFAHLYRSVVVAGGGNLRYTPQVRGS